jgi:parvulin-like peptidyl-prolyl isomerase
MARLTRSLLVLASSLTLLLQACDPADFTGVQAPPRAAPEQQQAAEAPPEADEQEPEAPQASVATGDDEGLGAGVDRIAASHILVAHESAVNRPINVHRTAGAARKKAEQILERLRAGEDFTALAKSESDCASASKGGFLGGFDRGTMATEFEAVAFSLQDGQLSGLVETPFGFHIIRREELAEIRIAQILIGYRGTFKGAGDRSREEALALARLARERLAAGEAFGDVARELSEGKAGIRGGDLGWFTRGQFLPAWEEHAFAVEVGAISEPFETSLGFHIVRRHE